MLAFSFAGLLLSSCTATLHPVKIIVSNGPPSMMRHQVVQTGEKFKAQPPTTLKQMSDMLGAPPMGTYEDAKGKYCRWEAYEESAGGGKQSAIAACLVRKNGDIDKYFISYCPRPFEHKDGPGDGVTVGDTELQSEALHPGVVKANRVPFRELTIKRGFAYGKEVVFSPSGLNAVFLPHGARVKEWVGETANISYPAPQVQPQQPAPPPPADNTEGFLNVADSALRLIETIIAH